MKKSLALIILSVFLLSFTPQKSKNIKWVTFDELRELQKTKPRKVFIDVYTDWCGWCKHMDKTTFSDPEVAEYVNEKYYAVKLNAEGGNKLLYQGKVVTEAELAGKVWGITGYPTTVYLGEDMNPLTQPVPGFLNKDMFIKVVKFFGEGAYKTQTWEQYQQSVK